MITIVLVDDHKIVRQGIRQLLETEPEFKVVGEAANGMEGVEVDAGKSFLSPELTEKK